MNVPGSYFHDWTDLGYDGDPLSGTFTRVTTMESHIFGTLRVEKF